MRLSEDEGEDRQEQPLKILICVTCGFILHTTLVISFQLGLFASAIVGVWLAIGTILAACLWEWEDYDDSNGGTPA